MLTIFAGALAWANPSPYRAASSDAFDDWTPSGADPLVVFTASERANAGSTALEIVRPAADTTRSRASLSQLVEVRPGGTLDITFYARTVNAAVNAVEIQVGGSDATAIMLPPGSYGWTEFHYRYQVPPSTPHLGVSTVKIAIVSRAPTDSTEIDRIRATSAGQNEILNGGFEYNSADLAIQNASLLFHTGRVALNLVSSRYATGRVQWTLTPLRGEVVSRGAAELNGGSLSVDFTAKSGYYTFRSVARLGGRTITRSTNLLVMPNLPANSGELIGAGVHLATSGSKFGGQIDTLDTLGVRNVRSDIWWSAVESTPGKYVFTEFDGYVKAAEAAGVGVLLIPDYSNPLYDGDRTPSSAAGTAAYAKFAAAVAAHYPQADIDVYNEFNGAFNTSACGKSPSCYLELLKPTYKSVRAAAPHTELSAPSLSGMQLPWLQQFIRDGGLRYTSAVAFHPYIHNNAPDQLNTPLLKLRASMRATRIQRPIWFTEFGYSTYTGGVSEQTQADYLLRATVIGVKDGLRRFYWYDAFDDSTVRADPESSFGLFRRPSSFAPNSWVPKPSAAAESTAARLLAGRRFVSERALGGVAKLYTFGSGKSRVRIIWSTGAERSVTLYGPVTVYDDTGAIVARTQRSSVKVTATSSPLYVLG